jgi:hypothetical protein
MSFCKVNGCHFSDTHITSYHECGRCNQQGHGMYECGKPSLIYTLMMDTTEIPFSLQCCVPNCKFSNKHITKGHQCIYCKIFGHDILECPEKQWNNMIKRGITFGRIKEGFIEEQTIKFTARLQMGLEEKQIYTKVYGGMGCIWYARRKNNYDEIELFFMHSDNWGQYGKTTDERPNLEEFLTEYRNIDKI